MFMQGALQLILLNRTIQTKQTKFDYKDYRENIDHFRLTWIKLDEYRIFGLNWTKQTKLGCLDYLDRAEFDKT